MSFKKGEQNIDSVFYGTDYVERMYLGGEQFFQASYLDFYKTNFFSIGLGQKKQIHRQDNNGQDKAISLIKTEWSPQYGYQLEIKQDKKGGATNFKDSDFRDNFSFILPKGKYLAKVNLENISSSTGELYCRLVKKGKTPEQDDENFFARSSFWNGTPLEISATEDTEVYLGMYINDLNPGKTSIFSLELFPATGETGNFMELPSLMVRGRKKEIYNSGASSIDIKIPATAFYEGVSYPVQYIDSDAFNYEVTENGTTVSQPLTKIKTIAVEGNNMIGFGNRAFQNCSNCTSFSCTSSVFQGGLFANNAAFEGCGALEDLTLSIVKNINGLRESQNLNTIFMGGRGSYSFDNSFAGNTSIETIHWKNKDSFGAEKAFTANFGLESFKGCTNLKTIVSNDFNSILGEDTAFSAQVFAFEGCTSLNTVGAGFGANTGPLYSDIGSQAFSGCTGLTSVDFGTKAGANTIIRSQAFENCTGLTSINLPNTVTSIGSEAFKGCSSLESINIPFIGESATSTHNKFRYIFGTVPTSLKTVGFSQGNNITKIPDYAFQNYSNITSINNNDTENIVSIGQYAYSGTGITSIKISSTLVSIGSQAFSGCTGLTSVDFGGIPIGSSSVRSWGSYCFLDSHPRQVILPGGKDIDGNLSPEGNNFWMNTNRFVNVESNPLFPDGYIAVYKDETGETERLTSFKNIGLTDNSTTSSFDYCYAGLNAEELSFDMSNQGVATKSFIKATIENLNLSNSSNSFVGDYAFLQADIFTINIDFKNINLFQKGCFKESGIKNLLIQKSTSMDSIKLWGKFCWFENEDANPLSLGVSFSTKDGESIGEGYIDVKFWNDNRSVISGYGYQFCNSSINKLYLDFQNTVGITAMIPTGECKNCIFLSQIEQVNTSASVSLIWGVGDEAFFHCSSLPSDFLSSAIYLEFVGRASFKGCTSLTSVNAKFRGVEEEAFKGCTGIQTVRSTIAVAEAINIGEEAFADCSSLTLVDINTQRAAFSSLGAGIFKNCNKLAYIDIPSYWSENVSSSRRWTETIFYLFNTAPSSYVFAPEIGAYSCVFGERYSLFLPHSLKQFRSPSKRNYNSSYTIIGYTLYNNNDGSTPALLFQEGQGETTVRNSASSYSEQAFKNNNGTIKFLYY